MGTTKNSMKKNKALKLIISMAITILLLNLAYSIPLPHGVSGIIYELDGITQVPNGIDFSVYNPHTGQFVQGKTGYGNRGRYSVSLKGDDGDSLIIKTWNSYNSANLTLTLTGVMRHVNLQLNMTFPPLPPTILTEFVGPATQDILFTSQIIAIDENKEDALVFSFVEAPVGIEINSSNGLIRWTPTNDDVGVHTLTVRVSDGIFTINRSYTLEVLNVNDPPSILSLPIGNATEDIPYSYQVDAIDIDADDIEFILEQSPQGMSINLSSGFISWLPTNDDVGTHNINITATDGELLDEQNFILTVVNVNDLPVIISLPVTSIEQDMPYVYPVIAIDVDSPILNYWVVDTPPGMSINRLTGNITWLPRNEDVGIHNITVKVSDETDNITQQFALEVININDAPVITSTPHLLTKTKQLYIYNVSAHDIDGDTLQYLLFEGPSKAILDINTGKLTWKPKGKDKGLHDFLIVVSDGNLSVEQFFTVEVVKKLESSSSPSKKSGKSGKKKSKKQPAQEVTPVPPPEISIEEIISNLSENTILIFPSQNSTTIYELGEKPQGVESVDNKVYKYLEIGGEPENLTLLFFKVEKQWINDSGISIDSISLKRYVDNEWVFLDTANITEDENYVYYLSLTPGFSYFAITVKEGISALFNFQPLISSIDQPYTILGMVFDLKENIEVPIGTQVIIQNLNTKEILEVLTGIGDNSGAYAGTITGEVGQVVNVSTGGIHHSFTLGKNNIILVDFIQDNNNGIISIMGSLLGLKKTFPGILFILSMLLVIISIIIINLKGNKHK